jgi:hypothetical protein
VCLALSVVSATTRKRREVSIVMVQWLCEVLGAARGVLVIDEDVGVLNVEQFVLVMAVRWLGGSEHERSDQLYMYPRRRYLPGY